jgi:hypothetical protein
MKIEDKKLLNDFLLWLNSERIELSSVTPAYKRVVIPETHAKLIQRFYRFKKPYGKDAK